MEVKIKPSLEGYCRNKPCGFKVKLCHEGYCWSKLYRFKIKASAGYHWNKFCGFMIESSLGSICASKTCTLCRFKIKPSLKATLEVLCIQDKTKSWSLLGSKLCRYEIKPNAESYCGSKPCEFMIKACLKGYSESRFHGFKIKNSAVSYYHKIKTKPCPVGNCKV